MLQNHCCLQCSTTNLIVKEQSRVLEDHRIQANAPYSNLTYETLASIQWWSQSGSNRRPPACKAGALPAELWPQLRVNQCGYVT